MGLWAINPDGINARLVYKNYTKAPHCTFEPKPIPGSHKIIFTAQRHHAQTMGSLVLARSERRHRRRAPITRLTPEVPFPEIEGWPRDVLRQPVAACPNASTSSRGARRTRACREGRWQRARHERHGALSLRRRHADSRIALARPGHLLRRSDPAAAAPRPPVIASNVEWDGPQEGRFLVATCTAA